MFKCYEPVTVQRTSGDVEMGWYFASLLNISPYMAPELVARHIVRVVCPLDPNADLRDPKTIVMDKHVRLGDLIAWQELGLALGA